MKLQTWKPAPPAINSFFKPVQDMATLQRTLCIVVGRYIALYHSIVPMICYFLLSAYFNSALTHNSYGITEAAAVYEECNTD